MNTPTMTLNILAEFTPFSRGVVAFLVTYAIHSTILLISSLAILARLRRSDPQLRVLNCRIALAIPLATSLFVISFPASPWSAPLMLPDFHLVGSASVNSAQESSVRSTAHARIDLAETNSASAPTTVPARSSPSQTHRVGESPVSRTADQVSGWLLLTGIWLVSCLAGLVSLTREIAAVRRLRQPCPQITEGSMVRTVGRLAAAAGIRKPVALYVSDVIDSPLAAGIIRPFLIVPSGFVRRISRSQTEAMLAHEIGHVASRDALWNLVSLMVCRLFWFQPLNHVLRGRLRTESEFLADRIAVNLLEDGTQLAGCLAEFGEWLHRRSSATMPVSSLASGMSSCRSILGRRVESLLQPHMETSRLSVQSCWTGIALTLLCALLMTTVPRASAGRSAFPTPEKQEEALSMNSRIPALALLGGLALSSLHDVPALAEPAADSVQETPASDAKIGIPPELQKFNGMVIGKMISRDTERGTFTVKVDYIARVWENNKAENPRAAVGRTIAVGGVTGKWLDNLLLIKPGDTMEFEAQHRGGDTLTFPGEWLRKTEPFDPADHPTPPDAFRGFSGIVIGKIETKQNESGELILRVQRIEKTFEKNKAKNAESIVDKPIVVAGFWGKMRKPFDEIQEGDSIRVGLLHRVPQSDHFGQVEIFEKAGVSSPKKDSEPRESSGNEPPAAGLPAGIRGFRGVMTGVVISRDAEKGHVTFKVDGIPRVGKQSKATDPESAIGRQLTMEGYSGRFLDTLLLLEAGDRIETGASHNRGELMAFPGELFRKVE